MSDGFIIGVVLTLLVCTMIAEKTEIPLSSFDAASTMCETHNGVKHMEVKERYLHKGGRYMNVSLYVICKNGVQVQQIINEKRI
ncbi:hypothetical protein [Alishewanella phage vB_AspM_Slicko01]|nr:hypothetical protein [Alishewanella phage vB_AspM_Slicko01]